jgi:hypothetical protein
MVVSVGNGKAVDVESVVWGDGKQLWILPALEKSMLR